MGGIYGKSQVSKLVRDGRYDEAVQHATATIERAGEAAADLAEAHFERAQAFTALGRNEEAHRDLEAALELDREAGELDVDAVDDAYFSALLAVARHEAASAPSAGAARLRRYRELFPPPRGQHHRDVDEWRKRLLGETPPALIIKERD